MFKKIALLVLLALLPVHLYGASSVTSIMPIPCPQFSDANGKPYSGGTLTFYSPGTTTLKSVYTDSTGATPLSNPVVLDSAGRACPWLSGYYKVALADSLGNVIWTIDNVSSQMSTSSVASEWLLQSLTQLTYLSATQFSASGDVTPTFQVNRRIQATVSAGTVYGRVSAASFGSGITTVTVVLDSGALDSGLSAVSVGIISATNSSFPGQTASNTWSQAQTFNGANTFTADQKISKSMPTLTLDSSDGASSAQILAFAQSGTVKALLAFNPVLDQWHLYDQVNATVRVAFDRLTGKMATGIVTLARVGASFDVVIPSTASGAASSDVTITHGLGTDDVTVIIRGNNTTVLNMALGWKYPDGTFNGVIFGSSNVNLPATPASGSVNFKWRNDTGSTTGVTFKVDILRRS